MAQYAVVTDDWVDPLRLDILGNFGVVFGRDDLAEWRFETEFVGTITDQPRATTGIATLPSVNFSELCIMGTNFVFICPERATVLYAFALDDVDHLCHRFLRHYYSPTSYGK